MKEKKRILIVDDEHNIRRILQAAFDKHGWHGLVAEDGHQALAMLSEQHVDVVLTDVTMPGMTGYELQSQISDQFPYIPVVIMTAFGTIPQAVAAIRNGAFEFVTKPFDLDNLKKVIEAAVSRNQPTKRPRGGVKTGGIERTFIAESPVMKELVGTIRQVADSRATVLITGESGTGKEVVSRLIHALSPRQAEAFVAVSCAALPETLLESELFGHEKGAFTGADSAKAGRFEMANNGTLFLDEIGDIPMPIQIKLLRVLQEREFERLGSSQPTKVDVRLITATNRDLQRSVDEGTFRLDLLYRLQVVELELPPLRKRTEDIEPLTLHFLAKYSAENGRSLDAINSDALAILQNYDWPGNVRELENTVERACVLANSDEMVLTPDHLSAKLKQAA